MELDSMEHGNVPNIQNMTVGHEAHAEAKRKMFGVLAAIATTNESAHLPKGASGGSAATTAPGRSTRTETTERNRVYEEARGIDRLTLGTAASRVIYTQSYRFMLPDGLRERVEEINRYARDICGRRLGTQRICWIGIMLGLPAESSSDEELVAWAADGAKSMGEFTSINLKRDDASMQARRILDCVYEASPYSAKMPPIVFQNLERTHANLRRALGMRTTRSARGVVAAIALSTALPEQARQDLVNQFLMDLVRIVDEVSEMPT
jgi:hypothetical protein